MYGVITADLYGTSTGSFKIIICAKTADGFDFSVSKVVTFHIDVEPKDHLCDICGATASGHDLENIPAKAATVTETGNTEYWHCLACGKYFADVNGENEIELADTVIAMLPPEIIKGKGQSIVAGENKELSFTSNAAFSDFIRAQLDGKTLDEKNYTVKEGSTVVTLKADYVATLSAGEHTIRIVSESGTAAITFTVQAKTAVPQTGDNSHTVLWIAVLLVSGGTLIVTTIVSKKRKRAAR